MQNGELNRWTTKRTLLAGAWILGLMIAAGAAFILVVGFPAGGWETGIPISISSLWLFVCFFLLTAAMGAGVALLLQASREKHETKIPGIPDGHPHPGISMHRLKIGGGVAGFIFAIGSVLIFLLGIPAFWGFLGLALIAGACLALLLRRRKALKIITIAPSEHGRI